MQNGLVKDRDIVPAQRAGPGSPPAAGETPALDWGGGCPSGSRLGPEGREGLRSLPVTRSSGMRRGQTRPLPRAGASLWSPPGSYHPGLRHPRPLQPVEPKFPGTAPASPTRTCGGPERPGPSPASLTPGTTLHRVTPFSFLLNSFFSVLFNGF